MTDKTRAQMDGARLGIAIVRQEVEKIVGPSFFESVEGGSVWGRALLIAFKQIIPDPVEPEECSGHCLNKGNADWMCDPCRNRY